VYQKELELVKANSKASDMEKELEMTRQARGKEQETEKTGKSSEEPRKESNIFKVTQNIVKEEVPIKKFRYKTNYEPRRLLSYIELSTKLSDTSEEWQHYEDLINERVLNGEDPLLERKGDSLEYEDTVESENSNDSDKYDISGNSNEDDDNSENSNGGYENPVNSDDYNGDDDDYENPENSNDEDYDSNDYDSYENSNDGIDSDNDDNFDDF